ncbi:hypothetical protein MKW98_021027 [Papaver atlanticum]|uniref:TF-B3 domain-containing protein n=1 Tax=Papaver atlanticum TaxID=357466 RepID=A0AAD4T9D2_9MAGN|nr:hypothetical protein MKW98_021027 [Papaver atlanticum]
MDVLLQNEEGCIWDLRVSSYVSQIYFNKGWKMFAMENKLKIGDYVIFEPVDKRPDAELVMNFQILLDNCNLCLRRIGGIPRVLVVQNFYDNTAL